MSENQKKILEMLASKKIGVDEAYRLLSALKAEGGAPEPPQSTAEAVTAVKTKAKYLHVTVKPGAGHEHDEDAEVVNVRVPMSLLRSGIKLASLLPDEAGDKVADALEDRGIDLDVRNMKPEDLEEIIEALQDLEVNVENKKEVVKVFVE